MGRYIVGLLLILGMVLSPAVAQDTALNTTDITTQFETLEDTTESIRGLETLNEVEKAFPSRADVQAYINETIQTELSDEIVTELMAFYVAFDFLDPKTDLRQVYADLLGQQVAGYYDTDTKLMNVIAIGAVDADTPMSLGLLERIIYVHEYVHALQDQHFDLDAYMEVAGETENSDMALARTALVEGDATHVMNQYAIVEANKNPLGSLLELAVGGSQMGGMTLPPDTPTILGSELLFPYLEGEQFVQRLLEQGGQALLDRAYQQPPESTEQIIHPELYLAGEKPMVVTLPEIAPADDWTPITSGVLGEFYLEQHLLTQLSPDEARDAAAGWGGDAFQIYQKGSDLALVVHFMWDSPDEQKEFQSTYLTFAAAQMGITAQDECFRGPEGFSGSKRYTCYIWRDNGSFIASAPSEELARQLLTDATTPQ